MSPTAAVERTSLGLLSRSGSVAVTAVAAASALVVTYVGVAVSVSLLQANHDATAAVGVTAYWLVSVVGPVFRGFVNTRGLERRLDRGVRVAAVTSLAAQVAFVPVVVAAFAM